MEKTLFRPLAPTLLTGLFLPAEVPTPLDAPLPDAPIPNPNLRLPRGGISLLYGLNASGLMGEALRRAQQQEWRAMGLRVRAHFGQVQAPGYALSVPLLPQVEVLWLNKLYVGADIAEIVQNHIVRYLEEDGQPLPKLRSPLSFKPIHDHPHLVQRLLEEPEFKHLRAVVLRLPGIEMKDGPRPMAQILYVRDLSALQTIRVDYGPPDAQTVFRIPTPEEQAQLRPFNPFAATLPKPTVIYLRVGPVG